MVGYVSEAAANAIKKWSPLKDANIVPVRATDGVSVVVNTPIPAIAVQVTGTGGGSESGVALGGGIRQFFELTLHVILPITNYSFSPDHGKQAEMLDMSDEVIRCMEQTDQFEEIRQKYDFSVQYDRMEADTSYGTQGAISVTVDVHRVIYQGSVRLDLRDSRPDVALEEVDIYEEGKNIKSIVI